MSREIKFRVWSKSTQKMSTGEIGLHNAYCFTGPNNVFMQFTGLHDKDGKEIWEGDILCWPKYEGTKHQSRWVVEWNSEQAAWSVWHPRNEAQVIGNIHEHGHLLTEVK